ncbi:MAG: alpha/beta hydrolase [Sphingobacterium mizutaii]|nr:alpha/beta hydrolase [Sphingobacterium mizutaii]
MMNLLIILISILALLIILYFIYVEHNLHSEDRERLKISEFGFEEKQVSLENGIVLNYGEGPDNGPALMLIHGQGVDWKNYAKVLPELSQDWHVFAIDCHGHGKSSHEAQSYTAEKMGTDFIWFIDHVIKEPVYLSGHSSGGLLAAWISANHIRIQSTVLEDPPLFSTEKDRSQKTFAWQDSFRIAHDFLQQSEIKDYLTFYLPRSYWENKFKGLWKIIISKANKFRAKYPNRIFRIGFIPLAINKIWESASDNRYDKRFADSFYDCSWFENFDQAETLKKIYCPTKLIFTKNSKWKQYDENGILMAAMSDEDAIRAAGLIQDCKLITVDSGHGFHDEHPAEFIKIIKSMQGI